MISKKFWAGMAVLTIGLFCINANDIYAAEAEIVFGSDSYSHDRGEDFQIGLYVNGDEYIGDYRIEVEYDSDRLEYTGSLDVEKEGTLILDGYGDDTELRYMLNFTATSGGDAFIKVKDAEINNGDDSESFEITQKAEAPITLSGEDTVETKATETTTSKQKEKETTETTQQSVEAIDTNNSQKSIKNYIPVIAASGGGAAAGIIILIVAIAAAKKKKKNREKFLKLKEERSIEKENNTQDKPKSTNTSENKKKDEKLVSEKKQTLDLKQMGEPIISVREVGISFKTATAETSGLKDYLIQKTKKKVKIKEIQALKNITFDIYKGEIIGIIGTNGSGKSTLLKIVSGVLNPTSGFVKVDKNKVQLLTLGTGFDPELSGRENVYLNGAIIGYSKKFIDEHYDEIVKFAELEGFMEQKVKTYSSGMVSRLGFAIATAHDAAEILILDEVLSVGDQFFRKKSLERVKKMIHGGSTVLIVSHNLNTIKEHCSRVVWIEKGNLRMVGNPEEVCASYAKSHEEINQN